MGFYEAFGEEVPDKPFIQSRITIAGLSLTALLFSGSFSVALNAAIRQENGPGTWEYRIAFSHIELALALGVIACVITLTCFLFAQLRLADESKKFFCTPQWWCATGQLFLYLALTASLSACLTEIVYGVGLASRLVAILIGVSTLPVWFGLYMIAPLVLLYRLGRTPSLPGLRAIWAVYILAVIAAIGFSLEIYRVLDGDELDWSTIVYGVICQLYQPIFWFEGWGIGINDRVVAALGVLTIIGSLATAFIWKKARLGEVAVAPNTEVVDATQSVGEGVTPGLTPDPASTSNVPLAAD